MDTRNRYRLFHLEVIVLLLIVVSYISQVVAHDAAHELKTQSRSADQIFPDVPQIAAENTGKLKLALFDEKGERTPALLGFQRADSWQWVAVEQVVYPNPRHPMQRSLRRQWRTKFPINSCGDSSVELPAGTYTVYVSKGLEYIPVKKQVEVSVNEGTYLPIHLKRFIRMEEKGWWSGDTHVHASRPDVSADKEILCAAQAEDIHITSTLLMSSPDNLEFPQYGYGVDGTVKDGDYWLVPGQEGPRTNELGHVHMLATDRLYHDPDNYHDYEPLFRAAKLDGAVIGLAHYFEEKFFPERSGAQLFHTGLIDFVELIDDTNVFKPEHYYQALNLGFRLPIVAGSDFPWGDHIGDQRTYANIGAGEKLTPAKWYAAVKGGKTFVTQGPLLDLEVNGMPIGSELRVEAGSMIKIRATATGYPRIGAAKHLRVIAMGDDIGQVTTLDRIENELFLELNLVADNSFWITAVVTAWNHSVAHTSPIYVVVGGKPIVAGGDKLEQARHEMINRLEFLQKTSKLESFEQSDGFQQSIRRALDYFKRQPYVPSHSTRD